MKKRYNGPWKVIRICPICQDESLYYNMVVESTIKGDYNFMTEHRMLCSDCGSITHMHITTRRSISKPIADIRYQFGGPPPTDYFEYGKNMLKSDKQYK